MTLASFVIVAIGSASAVAVVAAIILFNLASQLVNILNQTRLLSIRSNLRSRMNTAFVFCNFVGGAAGSALAGVLWKAGGWPLLTGVQAVFIVLALLIWAAQRNTLLSVEPKP
ncbi:hypothetical protein DKP76_16555 [Falsochrobactrum shanghaiense]|uniref:MFS transporter n=1 Tax=Falsochrobactrum shanghaiense TaxID=2201899 RepID=A0A316J4I0_9HYPH|nr:hypothetical protein [Falsochrobactrum shanghaiense]PWL16584.1 hypothetical protein DKP76_16555 [Falsochrobactrum shanghaiense]